jgi:hypothetical protein
MFPRPVLVDPAWTEETSPDHKTGTLAAGTGSDSSWPDATAPGQAAQDEAKETHEDVHGAMAPSTLPRTTLEWEPEIERVFAFLRGQRVNPPKTPAKSTKK